MNVVSVRDQNLNTKVSIKIKIFASFKKGYGWMRFIQDCSLNICILFQVECKAHESETVAHTSLNYLHLSRRNLCTLFKLLTAYLIYKT